MNENTAIVLMFILFCGFMIGVIIAQKNRY